MSRTSEIIKENNLLSDAYIALLLDLRKRSEVPKKPRLPRSIWDVDDDEDDFQNNFKPVERETEMTKKENFKVPNMFDKNIHEAGMFLESSVFVSDEIEIPNELDTQPEVRSHSPSSQDEVVMELEVANSEKEQWSQQSCLVFDKPVIVAESPSTKSSLADSEVDDEKAQLKVDQGCLEITGSRDTKRDLNTPTKDLPKKRQCFDVGERANIIKTNLTRRYADEHLQGSENETSKQIAIEAGKDVNGCKQSLMNDKLLKRQQIETIFSSDLQRSPVESLQKSPPESQRNVCVKLAQEDLQQTSEDESPNRSPTDVGNRLNGKVEENYLKWKSLQNKQTAHCEWRRRSPERQAPECKRPNPSIPVWLRDRENIWELMKIGGAVSKLAKVERCQNQKSSEVYHDELKSRTRSSRELYHAERKKPCADDRTVCLQVTGYNSSSELNVQFSILEQVKIKYPKIAKLIPPVDGKVEKIKYSGEAIMILLKSLFSSSYNISSWKVAIEVISIAKAYNLTRLCDNCLRYFTQNSLPRENPEQIIQYALHYDVICEVSSIDQFKEIFILFSQNNVALVDKFPLIPTCSISSTLHIEPSEFCIPLCSTEQHMGTAFKADVSNDLVFEAISGSFYITGVQLKLNISGSQKKEVKHRI